MTHALFNFKGCLTLKVNFKNSIQVPSYPVKYSRKICLELNISLKKSTKFKEINEICFVNLYLRMFQCKIRFFRCES